MQFNQKNILFYLLLFCLGLWEWSCVPLPNTSQNTSTNSNNNFKAQSQKINFQYKNKVYDEFIKTVFLAPQAEDSKRNLLPPVIPLAQGIPLVLEFDDLKGTFKDYSFEILHCNSDWTKSRLNANEYLEEFNVFPINDYENSFNTKINYIHYRAVIPRVKISGNFLVRVYQSDNPQITVLTKRFMVYQNEAAIIPKPRFSTEIGNSELNQQIDFDISYTQIDAINPREDFWVVIRQNNRWDNAIKGLKPTRIREPDKLLEYVFFDGENNFEGGNEFRQFDLRSLLFFGFHLEQIDIEGKDNRVRLQSDNIRLGEAYFNPIQSDFNGGFFIEHIESGRGTTESDYVKVYFTLKTLQPFQEAVYVIGEFNQWEITPENQLKYYPEEAAYQKSILLKQGVYDYLYVIDEREELQHYAIEGNHAETLNHYEIFVYHRPPNVRYERLVGYKKFYSNQR